MIDRFKRAHMFADKGNNSDAIVAKAETQGAKAVIPPRKSRKQPKEYDKALYKLRHLVKNAFLHYKRWRGIATHYAKTYLLSSLPYKFVASHFGRLSHGDTI